MTRIIMFGGHGKIARLTAPLLTGRGDEVTAVIRNPDHAADVVATDATPVLADIEQLDTAALAELVAGHDVVVWSAGAGGGSPDRTRAVDRDAAIRSMDAAVLAGVRRYVMVSYFGSSTEHGVDPENAFFTYAESKAAADEHLRGLDLDWTILGPSALTLEAPTGAIDTHAEVGTSTSRGNVARVIAAVLAQPGTVRRTICFNDGETPIAEALGKSEAGS